MTCRLLRLAIPGCQREPPGDWRARLAGPDAADAVLRYESLIAELQTLVVGPLRHAFSDQGAAQAWLAAAPRINASVRRDRVQAPSLPADLRRLLAERETLLYDAFYPGQRPDRPQKA